MSRAHDDLMQAVAGLKARGPTLGAIIAVEGWRTGAYLQLTVDDLDDKGWMALHFMAGREAVELAKRHRGQLVVVMPAAELARFRKEIIATNDPSAIMFGPKVYTVTRPAAPKEDQP